MRRFLLTFTVLSIPAWSQPAQQQAQPPIVVQVQMPPQNPWIRLVELIVPGLVGAAIAFLGVWWTNRRNAAENAANRAHQFDLEIAKARIAAESKSRANRWEFRKEVYVDVIVATHDIMEAELDRLMCAETYAGLSASGRLDTDKEKELFVADENSRKQLEKAARKYIRASVLAPLAVADSVQEAMKSVHARFSETRFQHSDAIDSLHESITAFKKLESLLYAAARKDLWDVPAPEKNAEAATQA